MFKKKEVEKKPVEKKKDVEKKPAVKKEIVKKEVEKKEIKIEKIYRGKRVIKETKVTKGKQKFIQIIDEAGVTMLLTKEEYANEVE